MKRFDKIGKNLREINKFQKFIKFGKVKILIKIYNFDNLTKCEKLQKMLKKSMN